MLTEKHDGSHQGKCTFCAENDGTGVWMTQSKNDVYCCASCAIDILPQLMADSIVGGTSLNAIQNSKGATNNVTKEPHILKRFNSAFNCALISKLRLSNKNTIDS